MVVNNSCPDRKAKVTSSSLSLLSSPLHRLQPICLWSAWGFSSRGRVTEKNKKKSALIYNKPVSSFPPPLGKNGFLNHCSGLSIFCLGGELSLFIITNKIPCMCISVFFLCVMPFRILDLHNFLFLGVTLHFISLFVLILLTHSLTKNVIWYSALVSVTFHPYTI